MKLIEILVIAIIIIIIAAIIMKFAGTRSVLEGFSTFGTITYNTRSVLEGFQNDNSVIVAPVPEGDAMKTIEDNLLKEREVISTLLPFYNKVVTITAGNKAKVATAPEGQDTIPKETVERNTKAAEPQVRKDIEAEGRGKVAPLYDINLVLDALEKSGLTKAAIYKISYMFLPSKIDIYESTTSYLNTKAEELYKYLINLGGPQTASQIQGSSADSMGITIKSGFADGPCCSVPDIKIDSAAIKTDKSLSQLVDQYKTKPPTPQDIQTLYQISKTRRRLLDESQVRMATLMETTKTNFKKLNDLMTQMEQSSDKAYSGIAEGKSPQAALDAFVDASNWSYAGTNTNYSFLLRT